MRFAFLSLLLAVCYLANCELPRSSAQAPPLIFVRANPDVPLGACAYFNIGAGAADPALPGDGVWDSQSYIGDSYVAAGVIGALHFEPAEYPWWFADSLIDTNVTGAMSPDGQALASLNATAELIYTNTRTGPHDAGTDGGVRVSSGPADTAYLEEQPVNGHKWTIQGTTDPVFSGPFVVGGSLELFEACSGAVEINPDPDGPDGVLRRFGFYSLVVDGIEVLNISMVNGLVFGNKTDAQGNTIAVQDELNGVDSLSIDFEYNATVGTQVELIHYTGIYVWEYGSWPYSDDIDSAAHVNITMIFSMLCPTP